MAKLKQLTKKQLAILLYKTLQSNMALRQTLFLEWSSCDIDIDEQLGTELKEAYETQLDQLYSKKLLEFQ